MADLWMLALDALAERIRDGRIFPGDFYAIHAAAIAVIAELERPVWGRNWITIKTEGQPPPESLIAHADGLYELLPASRTAAVRIMETARSHDARRLETSIERLAFRIDMDNETDAVREALLVLQRNGRAACIWNGENTHAAAIPALARFTLVVHDQPAPNGRTVVHPPPISEAAAHVVTPIRAANGNREQTTNVDRLAQQTATDPHAVREAIRYLTRHTNTIVSRHDEPADVDQLPGHARFVVDVIDLDDPGRPRPERLLRVRLTPASHTADRAAGRRLSDCTPREGRRPSSGTTRALWGK
ncbi:hypothetical protein [Asanoa iriomotensis]|uniref:DUF222 domain-containing protein n=1 Tax=Asanoa iriomotensis TaxID=234613 RepID=A0ABQ4CFU2_9ACTN|nr:hypothetical protein [Asanoa iriomotensis]GIF61643.1 hypothetical protein Air01nite_77380 [Asanoa iriomotensis]